MCKNTRVSHRVHTLFLITCCHICTPLYLLTLLCHRHLMCADSRAFSMHTCTHLHTLTHSHTPFTHSHTPCLAQQVRVFHKLRPACRGHACLYIAESVCAYVCVCFTLLASEKMLTVKETHMHTGGRQSCSLITVVSKESPWQ